MTRFLLALLLSILALPSAVAAAKPPRYVVGFLSRGDAWTPERSARIDSLQAGHMANMVRRYEEGWLVGAGPILDPNSSLRGLFFFKADSVEQVTPLVATDPAIAAGRLRIDLIRWNGPPGLGEEYRKAHTANPALKDSMVTYVVVLVEPPHEDWSGPMLRSDPKLILSGPLEGGLTLAVLAVADTAEARAWLHADPKVPTKQLRVTFRPWMVARGVIPGH
jgi:uncharacterized protein YciI